MKWANVDPLLESYCSKCDSVKGKDQFRAKLSSRTGLQSWCRSCEDAGKGKWYREHMAVCKARTTKRWKHARRIAQVCVREYLKSHACVDCGESDLVVLDFDHVRGKKEYNVGEMLARGMLPAAIMEEIEKCVVRCANCHRRKTAKETGSWRFLEVAVVITESGQDGKALVSGTRNFVSSSLTSPTKFEIVAEGPY